MCLGPRGFGNAVAATGEFMMEVVTTVPRSKNPSLLKDEELYEDLREQGNSKEKAAPSGALRSPPW